VERFLNDKGGGYGDDLIDKEKGLIKSSKNFFLHFLFF
jgi:hypothetical protein